MLKLLAKAHVLDDLPTIVAHSGILKPQYFSMMTAIWTCTREHSCQYETSSSTAGLIEIGSAATDIAPAKLVADLIGTGTFLLWREFAWQKAESIRQEHPLGLGTSPRSH
jgi:hypothetical protein